MKAINYIESFSTIDQCVEYLESIGCEWNYERESILKDKWLYKHKDYLVLYDPYDLLDFTK